jgi:hypothetical protein
VADPAFSLPVALAIAALGGGATLWAIFRSIIDHRHARTFRQKSIDAATPEIQVQLAGLFATELELMRCCASLKGQDWVVGRRLIAAAETAVHEGVGHPAECRLVLEAALMDCQAGNLEDAWAKLVSGA